MSLYISIDLISLSVPLIASFHPKVALYKEWQALGLALLLSAVPFLVWDIYFTENGYWGFSQEYLSGIYYFGLPLGEWLFFLCIPFACIFTHQSVLALNPKLQISYKATRIITFVLLAIFLLLIVVFNQRAYTLVDMIFGIVILAAAYALNIKLLQSFYITFLIMLIPFFLVNGVLTGTGFDNEIVWYNDFQNIGIRLFTIPLEDLVYAFSLILLNLLFFEKLKKVFSKN